MSINIHIEKKDLWLLAAVMVFLVGVAYVIAWGSEQPQIHGHSADEIEGVDNPGFTTYSRSGIGISDLGAHDLCFLSGVSHPDGDSGTQGCYVYEEAGSWKLSASAIDDTCWAMCVDW